MSKIKAYICGPIADLPNLNIEEFRAVETLLTEMGYQATVPHDLFEGIDTPEYIHSDYMKVCLKELREGNYDYVIVLQGWRDSVGAREEIALADELGITVKMAANELAAYALKHAPKDL